MAEITVLIGTHNFAVTNITPRGRQAVRQFAKKYIQWGYVKQGRQWVYEAVKVFAAATKDDREYRFHINTLTKFKEHIALHGLTDTLVDFVELPVPTGSSVDLPIFPKWAPREEQPAVIDYIVDNGGTRRKFVNLQTGKGKSFCTMAAANIMRSLTTLICKPMYIEKWIIDLKKTYDIEADDIITVQGGAQLMALTQLFREYRERNALTYVGMPGEEPPAKFIIVSNKTYQLWLKLYEEQGAAILDMGYACLPGDFFEFIGSSFRVIDEVHQDFHLNYKIDLYTHCAKSVSLSATLIADDAFISSMYEVAYPKSERYQGGAYDKYIMTKAVFYNLQQPGSIRFQDPSSNRYSHILYEQGIMSNGRRLDNYFKLIREILDASFIKTYKPGYKLMVFVASVEMATKLSQHLAQIYPQFSVTRYVQDDEYVNVMESDIRVSTLLSSGTAVDIPGLQTTLLTVAISSSQSNIQGLGRLRKLPDGSTPLFIWMTCEDITPHITYHDKKRLMLEPLTLGYHKITSSIRV